jgi:hypothetical protein
MSYNPQPPLGQATMANSLPVVIASNQSAVNVNVVNSTTASAYMVFALNSAASQNLTNIKASAGKVMGWYIYNSNAAARKIIFYNLATTPLAGSARYFSIVIPALSGANVSFPDGIDFSAGIGIATSTDIANSNPVSVATNDLIISIFYL